jgi:hypothetical protein
VIAVFIDGCINVIDNLALQVHTDEIQKQAETDLTKLICDTYKVARRVFFCGVGGDNFLVGYSDDSMKWLQKLTCYCGKCFFFEDARVFMSCWLLAVFDYVMGRLLQVLYVWQLAKL